MAKQTQRNQQPAPRSAPALPPIPTDTAEGIRAHAIADTLRALDQPKYRNIGLGLQLQPEAYEIVGERLGVPALFIASINFEDTSDPEVVEHIEAYAAWRQRLAAGKAVAR